MRSKMKNILFVLMLILYCNNIVAQSNEVFVENLYQGICKDMKQALQQDKSIFFNEDSKHRVIMITSRIPVAKSEEAEEKIKIIRMETIKEFRKRGILQAIKIANIHIVYYMITTDLYVYSVVIGPNDFVL